MAITTTGSFPKDLFPGVYAFFGSEYSRQPKVYDRMFDFNQSTRSWEELVERNGHGLARLKTEAGSVSFASRSQGVVNRATHATYGLGEIISREAIEDGQYEKQMMMSSSAIAKGMAETTEVLSSLVYDRAFDSTNYPFGDGVAILSASHPTSVGLQSNLISVASDLSEASLEALLIQIALAKDSVGKRIYLQPKQLIIPPNLRFEAERILKSTNQSGTANNDTNALRSLGGVGEIVVCPWLTDTDAWFIRTDAQQGMCGFWRRKPDFQQDNDTVTQNTLLISTMRLTHTIGDWRGLFGSAGA